MLCSDLCVPAGGCCAYVIFIRNWYTDVRHAAKTETGLITPREGRNAQRLLDALLASNGEWLDVSYG